MGDPLSVAASVVGLVTAAVQVSTFLYTVIQKSRHAPESLLRLHDSVDTIGKVLKQLDNYLDGSRHAPRARTSLIMVEDVAGTLASCVTTFSELQTWAEKLGLELDRKPKPESRMGLRTRANWVFDEDELKGYQARLEAQKTSLTLMLTILTCAKQDVAEDKVDDLRSAVGEIYRMQTEIYERMQAWNMSRVGQPNVPTQGTIAETEHVNLTGIPLVSPPAYPGTHDTANMLLSPTDPDSNRNRRAFAFEELLLNSRAYRQAARNNSDAFSVISAAGRTATWSMLSGLSLSEMSNIAILAIPIYASDLDNKEAYDFEVATTDVNHNSSQIQSLLPITQSQKQRLDVRGLFKAVRTSISAPTDPKPSVIEPQTPKVFGVALVESIRYANVAITLVNKKGKPYVYGRVPIIVAKCCSYLKKKAIKTEDVFARGGHAARIAALQKAFDTPDQYGRNLKWPGYTPADATGVLLRYLKSLPEPVIPFDHYDAFTAPFRDVSVDFDSDDFPINATINILQRLIAELPADNRNLFLYIIDILSVTANHAEENKMTPARLVSIFQPSLMSRPAVEMDSEEHICAAHAATFLVTHQRNSKFLDGNGAVAPSENVLETTTTSTSTTDTIQPIANELVSPPHTLPHPSTEPEQIMRLPHASTDLSEDFMGSISLDNAAMIAYADASANEFESEPDTEAGTRTKSDITAEPDKQAQTIYELSNVVSPITGELKTIMSAPDVSTHTQTQTLTHIYTSGSHETSELRPETIRSITLPLPLRVGVGRPTSTYDSDSDQEDNTKQDHATTEPHRRETR